MSPKVFFAGAAAIIAAGCSTMTAPDDANIASSTDRHKIGVTETAERMELPVTADDTVIAAEFEPALQRFARRYIQTGHGAMVISTPNGAGNADAALRIADHLRTRMAEFGIPFAAVARASYDGAHKETPPIILSFLLYEAQAPECEPLWSQDLAHNPSNLPWRSFGCAQQANLAAMLADPGDLLGPRDEDPRDAGRRAHVLEAYRQGKQTHAERTDDERVQVSKAVE